MQFKRASKDRATPAAPLLPQPAHLQPPKYNTPLPVIFITPPTGAPVEYDTSGYLFRRIRLDELPNADVLDAELPKPVTAADTPRRSPYTSTRRLTVQESICYKPRRWVQPALIAGGFLIVIVVVYFVSRQCAKKHE